MFVMCAEHTQMLRSWTTTPISNIPDELGSAKREASDPAIVRSQDVSLAAGTHYVEAQLKYQAQCANVYHWHVHSILKLLHMRCKLQ